MVSIIIPVKNEAEYISQTLKSLISALEQTITYELIFIDDSSDKSYDILVSESLRYSNIIVRKGKAKGGYGAAIKHGFSFASGDYIIIFNSDLCNTTEDLLKLIKASEQNYDVIVGCRYTMGGQADNTNKMKYYTSIFANRLLEIIFPYVCKDYTNSFKCYKKTVIDKLNLKRDDFSFTLELALKSLNIANNVTSIPVVQQKRTFGSSKMPAVRATLNYLMVAINFIFSKH